MKGVKAVFFDLGNTLVDLDSFFRDSFSIDKGILKRHGFVMEKRVLKGLFEKTRTNLEKVQDPRIKHGHFGFWGTFFKLAKIKVSKRILVGMDNEFSELFLKKITLIKKARFILRTLKSRGFKLGLISNGSSQRGMRILQKFELKKYFDLILISQKLGYEKASMKPFKIAMMKFKVKPKECVMIGDKLDQDIAPAKKLGIKTILVDRGSKWSHSFSSRTGPDIRIHGLEELLAAVGFVK